MEACAALKEPGGHPVISEPADIVKGLRVKAHLTHYCSPTSLFLRCELSTAIADAEGQDEFHISPRNNHVDDAFIGMSCLVCQGSIGTLALRALVTDVHRDTSGAALNVEVLYVDSGWTDFVGLDSVYTIDAEAAAEPQRAIACCLRSVEPTAASSSFDLKELLERGAVFEALFYTASDAGVYNVDLYATCHDQKFGPKTYDVGRYLVQNGFAKFMDCLADTLEAVASTAQSGVSVPHNSGDDTHNSTLQRPLSLLPTSSEPTGDIPPLRGAESSAVNSLEILVTFVSSPDHFYGQNVNKVEEWSLVQNLILQSTKQLFLETEIKTGATYIHRELPEQSGARVRVEDVQESGMCRIFLLDYGNRKTVHFSSLFMAHPRLSCIPPLAMRFQLSDVQPLTAWTEAAVNRFVELAHTGTPLTAVLAGTKRSHDQFNDTVHTVKLFSPTDGDVAECMTEEGHAKALTNRTALEPVQNPARHCDAMREDHNGPLFSDINAEDASVGASNVGTTTGRRICRFYATQDSCRQDDRCAYSHGLRTTAPLSKPVIDPVKQLRPPEVGSYVLGQVSAVASPSCFFLVFPYGRRSVERLSMEGRGEYSGRTLEALIRRLQAACKKRSFRENKRIVKAQGELVAAKSNQDGRWYRARVVSLEEGDMLKVFYVDFGFCESVPVDQVRSLEVRFTHLPQQALQACLVTNKHENRLGDKPTWDAHSCEAFANCVSGKDLVVKIVSVAQGMLHVRLFFTDGEQLCSVWRCLRNAYRTDLN